MNRRSFTPARPARPDRSTEFASWKPRARSTAPSTGPDMAAAPAIELAAPIPSTLLAIAHMGRIKAMDCVCCRLLNQPQRSSTDVHHIRWGRIARNDWLTVPLCHEGCHQGPNGVHGDRTYLRLLQLDEPQLLAVTIELNMIGLP